MSATRQPATGIRDEICPVCDLPCKVSISKRSVDQPLGWALGPFTLHDDETRLYLHPLSQQDAGWPR